MYLWCYYITPELLLNKLMVLANTLVSIVSRVLSNTTYIDEIHRATVVAPGRPKLPLGGQKMLCGGKNRAKTAL